MQRTPRSNGLRPIGDAVEDWLDSLDGPARLEAFYRLPVPIQRAAWRSLRLDVERERQRERAA
jgi:hypothetical protein